MAVERALDWHLHTAEIAIENGVRSNGQPFFGWGGRLLDADGIPQVAPMPMVTHTVVL